MSTPTPPVKGTEEYFNSGRLRVIAMITAATLAVGALGGIAGVVFDPDPVPKDHVVEPGGGAAEGTLGSVGSLGSLGAPGNASPRSHGAASPFTSRLPGADATDYALRVSSGLRRFVAVRMLTDAPGEPFTFARSFVAEWCGLRREEAYAGIKALRRAKVIVQVGTIPVGKHEANLYVLGAVQ